MAFPNTLTRSVSEANLFRIPRLRFGLVHEPFDRADSSDELQGGEQFLGLELQVGVGRRIMCVQQSDQYVSTMQRCVCDPRPNPRELACET